MNAREKAKNDIMRNIHGMKTSWLDCEVIAESTLHLTELAAYFQEKFENEPGRLVAKKECSSCRGAGNQYGSHTYGVKMLCDDCNGTGTITRRLTRKEEQELLVKLVGDSRDEFGDSTRRTYIIPSGERVSVEE